MQRAEIYVQQALWARKVNRAGLIPIGNAELSIHDRRFVTNEDKSRSLGDGLEHITDAHVRMSLAARETVALLPGAPAEKARRNADWKLIVNADVKAEA
ncbi:MAG: hypothetical protein ABI885_17450 [Gammaproteobacteria bacterium]